MTRRFYRLQLGLLVGGLVAAAAVGCGGDDDNDDPAVTAGSGGSAGTAGKGGKGGSKATGGDQGTAGDDEPGTAGGAGEPAVVTADIDEVVGAICDWEFRCCDAGELTYRLSPTITDAADCSAFFVNQLREDNSTDNPYVAGNALGGLLGQLGYQVDLTRVAVNAANVAACVEQWDALGCMTEPDPDFRCDGAAGADPCALHQLFEPTLELDAPCTIELTEGVSGGNDIECLPGSTCLAGGTAENDNDFDACVQRGEAGDPCTADDDCDFDFFCNEGGDCEEKAGPGDDCSFEDPSQPAAGEEAIQCKAGLSCHPVDFVCLAPCQLGAACAADAQCPDGTGCAPLTVENDTTSFVLCADPGNAATDRCNTAADCIETRYCDGSVCQPDVANTEVCVTSAECAAGSHCSLIAPNCTANLMPGDPCTAFNAADACGPAPARCVMVYATGTGVCSAGPVENGEDCSVDADCESGLCEFAGPAATVATCIAGVGDGDPCDAVVTTGDDRRCGPGFYCNADAVCAPQSGPGGSCEDPVTTNANGDICTNATCANQWEELMCTDGPVAVTRGGTNITCDGEP